jgi:hypothetical protein
MKIGVTWPIYFDDSLVFRSDDVPERTVELPGGDLGDALQITCRYAFEYV